MADEATTQSSGTQATSQSSSQSQNQSQSGSAAAQVDASKTTQSSQDGTTNGSQQADGNQAQQQIARPEWVPESFFDAKTGEVKGAELRQKFDEFATRVAAEDSRKASLPQTPEAYQLALPETFKAPDGIDVKIDASDPIYTEARKLAHSKGWSQQDFSEALGLVATMKAGEAAQYEALKTQNLAALGAKGPERIDAVTRWLGANFGEAQVKPILATLATTAHVEVFEKIISKLTSQGAATFRQGGREVETGKVDQATYDRMTYSEKKAYAEKHQGRAA